MATVEMVLTTAISSLTIDGVSTKVETYNGTVPGPLINLVIGDTLIVRLINDLPYPTGIHWHGIELQNSADGTPATQDGARVGPFAQPVPASPSGGTYLYKFNVTRPGIFWYHPHHYHSTNRVFRGLYGMIIIEDPDETTLVGGVLPTVAETHQIVLSDTTICRAVNPIVTYPDTTALPAVDRPEWLSGVTVQTGPSPRDLCELAPLNDDGSAGGPPFVAGDIPNVQMDPPLPGSRTVEGQTVLNNGQSVGGRLGTPLSAPPRALIGTPATTGVQSGRGVRLQLVNCAFARYFRLRLVDSTGAIVPLLRVGGEAGLLDEVVIEGGTKETLDMQYQAGEILLPPASRADVVAVIPASESTGNILTMWTRDFPRIGGAGGWSQIPSVPVMHFEVTGAGTAYTLNIGDDLRARTGFPGPTVIPLPSTTTALVTPTGGFVAPKLGMAVKDIKLTAAAGTAGIDSIKGSFSGFPSYYNVPHLDSTRYAKVDDILELSVTNMTNAHHPFHLHGFSFQPVSLKPRPGAAATGERTWLYQEYVDTLNVPKDYTLKFRVHITDRKLHDEILNGGAYGRWLFHCHIFFHAHSGMISELVISDSSGNEKPSIDVGGSWAYAPSGGNAQRFGTYNHPDGLGINFTTSLGSVTDLGAGKYRWDSGPVGVQTTYVFITATDTLGRQDQTVFRLQIGGTDEGSDTGDPHITTIDGTRYDFQAVGEFILLRDRDGMEVQTRQTPVVTANPITNPYTGLTSCVSVNTAVAVRVGSHRVSYQPGEEVSTLEFYVDGKRLDLTPRGLDLDGHRVTGVEVNGLMSLRIDYRHHAVLIVTPHFWNNNNIWYMNVSLSHTHGNEGIMGSIPENSWLPKLRNGATLGPRPAALSERYIELNKTFADSWRVNDASSLFVYKPGTSTATFTDMDWPAEQPPCEIKPQFKTVVDIPPVNIAVEQAKLICKAVTEGDLFENCVFDVATTGDKSFAESYLIAQQQRLNGTSVQVIRDETQSVMGNEVQVTAIVLPLNKNGIKPMGKVTFSVDEETVGQSVELDSNSHAHITLDKLKAGTHNIKAEYSDHITKNVYHMSNSPGLQIMVEQDTVGKRKHWSFWLILIIILLLILLYIIFS